MLNYHFTFSAVSPSRLCRALPIGTYSLSDITGALLLACVCQYQHDLKFVGGCSQVIRTNYKHRVVVAHASQLLIELSAHRALQRCHIVAISLLVLDPCRRTHLSVTLCDPLLNHYHRYPSLLCRWNLVTGSCMLLSRHFVRTRTRLIGHVA